MSFFVLMGIKIEKQLQSLQRQFSLFLKEVKEKTWWGDINSGHVEKSSEALKDLEV